MYSDVSGIVRGPSSGDIKRKVAEAGLVRRSTRLLVAAAAPAAVAAMARPAAANTVYLFSSGGASLDLTTNYTPTAVFGPGADLVIGQSSFTSTKTDYTGSYSQSIVAGSIDDLSLFAITVDNKAAGNNSSYVLGGTGNAGNSVANGSSASDLLYVATGASLTFTNYSSGTATVVLNQSGGTFDVAGTGTLTFNSAPITDAGHGYGFTKTGTGLLFLNGSANTFSGGITIAAGTVEISGGGSLGTNPASGANLTFSGNSTLQFDAVVASNGIASARAFAINSGVTGTIDTQTYSYSLSNAITGAGGLAKSGTGTLALAGNDTYTGATTVNAGTLQFNSSTPFTTSSLTVGSNATLSLGASATLTSTVPLTLNGGTLNLVAGQTTSAFASTTVGGPGVSNIAFGTTPSLALGPIARGTGSGTLDLNPTAGTTVTTTTANGTGTGNTGAILGGYLTYGGGASFAANDGSGNVIALPTASYVNTYATAAPGSNFDATTSGTFTNATINSLRFNSAAATTVTANGSLIIGSGGVLVTPTTAGVTSTLAGGTVTTGNGTDLIFHDFGGPLLVTASVVDAASGPTTLNKAGTGTLILDGPGNAYTGSTVIGAGTLQVGNGDANGNISAGAITDNGSLVFNRTDPVITSANLITGSGNLVMNGTGTLVLTQSDSFAGGTIINAGVIQFATTNNAGTGGFTINAGALRQTASLTSGRAFTLGATTSTIDASNGATFSLTNVVSGTGTLNVNNTSTTSTTGAADNGTVYLSGANTYSGGTVVAAGTLRANTAGATNSSTGSGPVTVNVGATLAGSGFILNTTGPVTVNGTIGAGASSTAIGNLSTGAQVWSGGGTFLSKFSAATPATGTFDKLIMSSLTINATAASPFTVTLSNTSTGVTVAAGTSIVLADDTDTTAANPFNVSGGTKFASLAALQQALLLSPGAAITAASGSLQLDTAPDPTGGEYLVLDTTAAPEPTSLLLAGVAAAPLVVGRRRRQRTPVTA
jgi:autotransporter-associated beta strand protein